jgi:RNA polymerase sigma-70 factor (ECF subfamily)
LRALPLGQREVLALALEGLPHAEIAAIVGITPENVAVRLGRARAALRRLLEKEAA